jgi:hypothetical protein
MDEPLQRSNPLSKRPLWLRLILATLLLPFVALCFLFALSLPAYFRSLSPLVLEAAARNTDTAADLARYHLDRGEPGLAEVLIPFSTSTETLAELINEQLQERPLYLWSGGPSPFYESFLSSATGLRESEPAVLPTLLPEDHRVELLSFLRQSPNQNVQAFLDARSLGGWQSFFPVFSSAGQPLDATLLTLALLEQSGRLQPEVSQGLRSRLQAAKGGDPQALASAELTALSLLTLGRYYNWLQLATLVEKLPDDEAFLMATRFLQDDPSRKHTLLAGVLMVPDISALFKYLERFESTGWRGLDTALGTGQGAVEALVRFGKPLYEPPAVWHLLPEPVTALQSHFKELAEAYPGATIALKVLAFAGCGILLVHILRILILNRPAADQRRRLLLNLDSITGGLLVTLFLWVAIEPGLLQFTPNEQGSLEINLAQILPEVPHDNPATPTSDMLDQVTILVLLLFLILQLLVFIFGLLKIWEIRKRSVSAQTKLHLLENEEVLFELGLYVGLGGTVSSLILVVLNIVDASLMAAYASTLFGIIFVALLKVVFLRPYRRALILEAAQNRS